VLAVVGAARCLRGVGEEVWAGGDGIEPPF